MKKNIFQNKMMFKKTINDLSSFANGNVEDLIFHLEQYMELENHGVDAPALYKKIRHSIFMIKIGLNKPPENTTNTDEQKALNEALKSVSKSLVYEVDADAYYRTQGTIHSTQEVRDFFEPLVLLIDRIDENDREHLLNEVCFFKEYTVDDIGTGLFELAEYMNSLWDDNEQNNDLHSAINCAIKSYDDNSTIKSFAKIIYNYLK